ncbi:hypothetical protein TI39_contig4444g00003 [Zymoseptoria brevis]|uniref:Uncharacterized protein n=1 Tax=Zymoseptoria brevis TaxID=1047168 RepID=A0A0F4G6N6_9PEZI|nr:hypothetical protein TI39_contig4444g00003 [Zymoseptoria brevis]
MANPQSRLPSARGPRPTSMFEVSSEHLKRLQNIGRGTEKSTVDEMVPAETATTSKMSKRRSFLPSFSSRPGTDADKAIPASIPEDTDSTTSAKGRAMPPPPKPSRLGSLRVPARTAAPHTRTASKDSGGRSSPSKSDTTEQPATPQKMALKVDAIPKRGSSTRLPPTGMRPPQSPGVRPPSSGLNQPSKLAHARTGSTASNAASTTSIAQKRSSMIAPRAAGTNAPQTSPPRSGLTRPTSSRQQMPPPSKAQFSTYQQHYSPAKTVLPKPPVPGIRSTKAGAPASATAAGSATTDEEVPITHEIALAQIELLQLSLLHQGSGEALEEYQASAKRKLGQRHAKLQKDFDAVRAQEQERRRSANLTALESWCADPDLLAEHLQTLSRVVTDLRSQTEPGSRYSELTDTFEKWAMGAESILLDDERPANFIEALPEAWRATHTSLALKFRSIQRDIGILPPIPPANGAGPPSSLEVLLENSSALVDGILKELEVMTKLQKEVLQRGKERIDEQINALVSANEVSGEKENWVPAWQSVT